MKLWTLTKIQFVLRRRSMISVPVAFGIVIVPLYFLLSKLQIQHCPFVRPLRLKEMLFNKSGNNLSRAQVLLWTQMRSGSSLMGELLSVLPQTFYTEEPLWNWKDRDGHSHSRFLNDILKCRFSQHLEYFKEWMSSLQVNDRKVKRLCDMGGLCENTDLVEAACRAASVNLIRVVTVDLSVAIELLQKEWLLRRVVHLVRDPRGVVASRSLLRSGKYGPWPLGNNIKAEEVSPTIVCNRYRQDLVAAQWLSRHYPQRYRLVRYEDLFNDPHQELSDLYVFLGLPYTAVAANTVSSHTIGRLDYISESHPYSTHKNASATVFAWRERLSFSEVKEIQYQCQDVLRSYGYRIFGSYEAYTSKEEGVLMPKSVIELEGS